MNFSLQMHQRLASSILKKAVRPMSIDELHDAFHLRLGRLTQTIAQLDLNIGLAVSWLGQNNGMDISNLIDPVKARFSMRLAMLTKLVDLTADQRTLQKAAEFAQWFDRVNALPALKNNYIHAKWSFHGIADGDAPYVLFKVPNWNHLPDQPDNGAKLTLRAFDQQIEELKQLTHDFQIMCDCRVAYVPPFVAPIVPPVLKTNPLKHAFDTESAMLEQLSLSMPFHVRPTTNAGNPTLN